MRVVHGGFSRPIGGVSPMKQEKEDKEEKKSKQTETSKAITEFITPQNQLELALSAFGGAGTGGGKLGTKLLTKTKLGRKLVSKIPGVSRWLKPLPKTTKTKKGFDFNKKTDYSGGGKPKGGVDGGLSDDVIKKMNTNVDRYGQPDPTLYGKPKSKLEFHKIIRESTEGVGALGRSIDDAGITIKNLDPEKSVKKIGTNNSGQVIYEVTYPNGEKLKFWESTGTGMKKVELSPRNAHLNADSSKGFFGVLPGNLDGSNVGFSKSWFIKTDGWERGYGSAIVEDTGIWLKSLKETGILK